MSDRPPIVAFIEARLAEDEAIAREAAGRGDGRWHAIDLCEEGITILDGDDDGSPDAGYSYHPPRNNQTRQITRHSPARVLRQCAGIQVALEAYREVVEINEVEAWQSFEKYVLPGIAMTWADHPDYRSEWAPAE